MDDPRRTAYREAHIRDIGKNDSVRPNSCPVPNLDRSQHTRSGPESHLIANRGVVVGTSTVHEAFTQRDVLEDRAVRSNRRSVAENDSTRVIEKEPRADIAARDEVGAG